MILSDHFVALHIPKTGGTWLRETLRAHAPKSWGLKVIEPLDHYTARDIPATHVALPRIIAVRNPFEWHVSQCCYWQMHYRNRTGGYARPETQWTERERAWARRLEECRTTIVLPEDLQLWFRKMLLLALVEHVRTQSQWHDAMVAGADRVHVIRFERLRASALEALSSCAPVPSELEQPLLKSPRQMTSDHLPWVEYYDARSRELVQRIEAVIIKRYGY